MIKKVKQVMDILKIKYYDYYPLSNTLTIYEPLPVNVMIFIRSQLNVKINIK